MLKKLRNIKNIVAMAFSFLILGINIILLPQFPLWNLTKLSYYRPASYENDGNIAVSLVPPNASVVAQDAIISHLSERSDIYELVGSSRDADFVLATKNLTTWPSADYNVIQGYLNKYEHRGYTVIFNEDGWVVLKHWK